MGDDKKVVLVVGTTPDYVRYILRNYEGDVIFLTDPENYSEKDKSLEAYGNILCDLSDTRKALLALENFLEKENLVLGGVAAYDCESLYLTALIAEKKKLTFASVNSVMLARDKYRSKAAWIEADVPCPLHKNIKSEQDIFDFTKQKGFPVVLKPAFLSGSELTFVCSSDDELLKAYNLIKRRLRAISFDNVVNRDGLVKENSVLIEEYIDGDEYSCDFTIKDGVLNIIRIARKFLLEEGPSGTSMAYEIPGNFGGNFSEEILKEDFIKALSVLGIDRSLGMCDFFVKNGKAYFLEISPRPGGDCLPWILKKSASINTILLNLDFALDKEIKVPESYEHLIGVRIHSEKEGRLKKVFIDTEKVSLKVLEAKWITPFSRNIVLPPSDYVSWYLGYVIFRPVNGIPVNEQIREIKNAVVTEYES